MSTVADSESGVGVHSRSPVEMAVSPTKNNIWFKLIKRYKIVCGRYLLYTQRSNLEI